VPRRRQWSCQFVTAITIRSGGRRALGSGQGDRRIGDRDVQVGIGNDAQERTNNAGGQKSFSIGLGLLMGDGDLVIGPKAALLAA
jgi:hypothetical protein